MSDRQVEFPALGAAESSVGKASGALLAITALAALSIWLVTSAHISYSLMAANNRAWYLRARNAECGYQAYLRQDHKIFELLAFAILKTGRYTDEPPGPPLSAQISPCNVTKSGAIGLPLWGQLSCFGKHAASVSGEPDERARAITSAIQSCFPNAHARELLGHPVVVRNLVWARDPDAWWTIAYWLTTESWPAPDRFGFGTEEIAVYQRRLAFDEGAFHMERLYDQLLDAAGEQAAIKSLLKEDADRAFEAQVRGAWADAPTVGLPGLSTSLRSDDLLMVISPLVVLAYLVFFQSWERRQDLVQQLLGGNSPRTRSGFPSFDSPTDPLALPWTDRGFRDGSARLLWFGFVIAPLLVVVIMFAFRGNLMDVENLRFGIRAAESGWIHHFYVARLNTWVSLAIDTLNLLTVMLVSACLIEISRKSGRASRMRRLAGASLATAAAMAVLAAWGLENRSALDYFGSSLDAWSARAFCSSALFLCFGLVWCWSLRRAICASSTTGAATAVAGLVFSFLLIIT